MNRTTIAKGLVVLVAGALIGGTTVAVATPSDPCEASYVKPMNSTAKLKAYEDCRFDRIDKALGVTPSPSASPSQKPSATPSASPSASVTPSVTPSPSESPSATRTPDSSVTPSKTPTPEPTTAEPTKTPEPTPTAPAEWPGPSNTGVPAGTTLTAYTGPSVITQAGTVIDSKTVSVCLDIRANNVTIRNSRFDAACFYNILSDYGNTGITITDTEIRNRNGSGDSSINGGGFTCLRCNIWGASDGVKAQSNVVIRDSWIHDQALVGSDPHADGIQSLGTTSLTIDHNTIDMKAGATSAVILSTGSADAMRNVTISNNLLSGGAFTVYGGYEAGRDTLSKVENIRIASNRFSTKTYPRSGAYGPMTSVDSPVVTAGNVWFDGSKAGQPI